MGFEGIWMAVKNAKEKKLLKYLKLIDSKKREDFPESKITLYNNEDWTIIISNEFEYGFTTEQMKNISKRNDVVACLYIENYLYNIAEYYHKGEKIWKLIHEGGEKIHMKLEGVLPNEISDYLSKQNLFDSNIIIENTDKCYDVVFEIAEKFVNFKIGREVKNANDFPFKVLQKRI